MMTDLSIVGAGLTAHLLWQQLRAKYDQIVLFEKSKGLGGRIATRRIKQQDADSTVFFNHGCPFFPPAAASDLSQRFQTEISDFITGGQIKGGLTELFKNAGAPVQRESLVKGIEFDRSQNKYCLDVSKSSDPNSEIVKHYSKQVILTAPVPQANSLLRRFQQIPVVDYSKAMVLLVECDSEFDEAELKSIEIVSLVVEVTRSQTSIFLSIYLDLSFLETLNFEMAEQQLANEISLLLPRSMKIKYCELKKWRYAQVVRGLTMPFLELAPGLFYTSDACSFGQSQFGIFRSLLSADSLATHLNT